jgi:hypothetical protein
VFAVALNDEISTPTISDTRVCCPTARSGHADARDHRRARMQPRLSLGPSTDSNEKSTGTM